jgi:orotate phosphoribosyltransferase
MAEPIDSTIHAQLVQHLLNHSVRQGDFVLKSGRRSSWFIDSKQTACDPEGILLMSAAALSVIPDDATAIGGLTVGADPVAYAVAAVAATRGRSLRSFTIRKDSKDHGVTGRLAGPLKAGDKVVITEDTVTRGTSLFDAVEVVLIMPLVDRGGTCAAMAADAGIAYRPLVTAVDLGFGYEGAEG